MKEITKKELHNINGGFSISGKFILIGGIFTFIIGIIDGFTRLKKCER